MDSRKATLKDISEKAGVSLSTVHKALYDKPGISARVRDEILAIAHGLGYQANYVASALKRKVLKAAFVMPLPDDGPNRFYYQDIWRGMRAMKAEAAQFNLEILEFGFGGSMHNLGGKLKEVLKEHSGDLAGLITLGLEDEFSPQVVEEFTRQGIPVTLIASDLPDSNRLCCVRAEDTMAGSLAAELLLTMTGTGHVLLAAGDPKMSSHYLNVRGFDSFLSARKNPLRVTKLFNNDDPERLYQDTLELLAQDPTINALYSCTARNTPPLCRAALDSRRKDRLCIVGSDLFRENRIMLEQGVMQAILYKNPYRLGYLGCRSLFDFLVKGQTPQSTQFIAPVVVMNSNLVEYDRAPSDSL